MLKTFYGAADSAATVKPVSSTSDVICRIEAIERLKEKPVASWCENVGITDRRATHRVRYTRRITVTPANARGQIIGNPFSAHCRDISRDGLSFTDPQPLPHRFVTVSFDEEVCRQPLLVELRWCRFTREQVYQCGGRFLRVVDDA